MVYTWDKLQMYESRVYVLRTFISKLMHKANSPDLIQNILSQYEGLDEILHDVLDLLRVRLHVTAVRVCRLPDCCCACCQGSDARAPGAGFLGP